MSNKSDFDCPICSSSESEHIFNYTAPPAVETSYAFCEGQEYLRDIYQCRNCQHFISVHQMNTGALYSDDYVSSTYADLAGVKKTFDKIINLPPENSDNIGRVQRIIDFATAHFKDKKPTALDIGAGLGVFPYQLRKDSGWDVTALDPDSRATEHISKNVGVSTITADFLEADIDSSFDLVTLNKVLEHVEDPIAMLARVKNVLNPNGVVYVELPDGESAASDGKEREEFTIDHPHIFSARSLELLAEKAGFSCSGVERLRDPSGKYTIYSFLQLMP